MFQITCKKIYYICYLKEAIKVHEMEMLKCSIMRGGTSKGIFFMENELPKEKKIRDKVICAIYGSPDIRQIDGLGGADPLTSKLAIIGPSTIAEADVDYTFGQVSINEQFVDYGGNCGNISSAVGPYAIDKGLVRAIEPFTEVKIHMTNTDKILTAIVPVKDGKALVKGDFKIDGVPGTGAKIVIDWSDAVGGCTGMLLPTGNSKDIIEVDKEKYEVSIVDAGNIVIFINAEELNMNGVETPMQIDSNRELMNKIEKIRGNVCVKLGLVERWDDASKITPYQPFFAIVSKSADYTEINGKKVSANEIDFVSRLLFMLKTHKAYPITGTVSTGAAARIKNSVVWDLLSEEAKQRSIIKIGHPAGVIEVVSESEGENEKFKIKNLKVYRTARIIMDGYVYVNSEVFQ